MKKLIYLIAPLMCFSTLIGCGGNTPIPPEILYKVTFVNDDGTTLLDEIDEVKAGEHITYSGDEPTSTNAPRESHYFEFDGFIDDSGVKLDDNYLMPSHNVVFTAQYLELGDLHTVNWVNYDGEALSDTEVNYESHPIYQGETPTKPDGEYDKYQFIGWIDEDGVEYSDDYMMPDHDVTFTAQFGEVALDGFIYELSEDGNYYINCGLVDKSFSGYLHIKTTYRGVDVKEIKNYAFKDGLFTHCEIPLNISTIGDGAFENCQNLLVIDIGKDVKQIGFNVFNGCTELQDLVVDSANETFKGEHVIIEKNNNKLIYGGNEGGYIPEDVKIIGKDAFRNGGITGVHANGALETIEDGAFYGCKELTRVDLTNSAVTSIGQHAFEECSSLWSLSMPNYLITIGDYAFEGCSELSNMVLPSSLTFIGDYAFSGCVEILNFNLTNLVTIGNYAFNGCASLDGFTLGNSLTSIGDYAFGGSTSLASVNLLSVEHIPSAGINIFGHKDSDSFDIYVKTNLVNSYKESSGWSIYANSIIGQ